MKVFISWSGEFSRKVAERLSIWIPTIIQSVDVFYSPDDIAKGENWGNRLSDELEQSNFGIVCLTPENVGAPWIHFEAGALSKAANSRVSAIMLGITPSEVKGPLARLQNTAFDRDDFYRLFQSINALSDKPLKPEILKNVFNNSWEKLVNDISTIIEHYASPSPILNPKTNEQEGFNNGNDALQEILRLVRALANSQGKPILRPPSNSSVTDSANTLLRLYNLVEQRKNPTCTVTVYCDENNIASVKDEICIYTHGSETNNLDALKQSLDSYGFCTVSIPFKQLNSFCESLKKCQAHLEVQQFDL